MKIEELNFSVRTYNCLKRGKIDTVEQLREKSDDDLMAIRNFGITCLKEVHQKLGQDHPKKEKNKTCRGYCRCQIASDEKQAIFTLGQMDMKESVILLMQDNRQATVGELIEMVRRM